MLLLLFCMDENPLLQDSLWETASQDGNIQVAKTLGKKCLEFCEGKNTDYQSATKVFLRWQRLEKDMPELKDLCRLKPDPDSVAEKYRDICRDPKTHPRDAMKTYQLWLDLKKEIPDVLVSIYSEPELWEVTLKCQAFCNDPKTHPKEAIEVYRQCEALEKEDDPDKRIRQYNRPSFSSVAEKCRDFCGASETTLTDAIEVYLQWQDLQKENPNAPVNIFLVSSAEILKKFNDASDQEAVDVYEKYIENCDTLDRSMFQARYEKAQKKS